MPLTRLYSFLGISDRNASFGVGESTEDLGPLARALCQGGVAVDELHLVDDRVATGESAHYEGWLHAQMAGRGLPPVTVTIHADWPSSGAPHSLACAFAAVVSAVESTPVHAGTVRLRYNLSSGTSGMGIALALVAADPRYCGDAFFVDRARGVDWVEWPAAIAAARTTRLHTAE